MKNNNDPKKSRGQSQKFVNQQSVKRCLKETYPQKEGMTHYERAQQLEKNRLEREQFLQQKQGRNRNIEPNPLQKRGNGKKNGASKTKASKQRQKPTIRKTPVPLTQGQKFVRMLIIKAVLLFVSVGIVVWLSLTVFFNIQAITVQGNVKYTSQEIENASGIIIEDNLFLTNGKAIEKKLEENFYYIEDAIIQKKLPSKINIIIKETTAVCKIKTSDGVLMVDRNGRILEVMPEDDGQAIPQVLAGAHILTEVGGNIYPQDSELLLLHQNFMAQLETRGIVNKVSYISYTDKFDLRLLYENRIEVKFGNQKDLDVKLDKFILITNERLVDADMGTLNMTLADLKEIPFASKNAIDPWWENVEEVAPLVGEMIGETVENTKETLTSGA